MNKFNGWSGVRRAIEHSGWPFNSFISSTFSSEWESWLKWRELTALAARPVSRMKKLMELIYEWSLKGRCLMDGIDLLFAFFLLVGYGRCPRQGLRQKEANKAKKQINGIQSNKAIQRERRCSCGSSTGMKRRLNGAKREQQAAHQRPPAGGKSINSTSFSFIVMIEKKWELNGRASRAATLSLTNQTNQTKKV